MRAQFGATLSNFPVHVVSGNFSTGFQIGQPLLNFGVEGLSKLFWVLSQFQPIEQRLDLVIIQTSNFFNGQLNPTHMIKHIPNQLCVQRYNFHPER